MKNKRPRARRQVSHHLKSKVTHATAELPPLTVVRVAAAPLTVPSPEIGTPRLGQSHRLTSTAGKKVHKLDAAGLPTKSPIIGAESPEPLAASSLTVSSPSLGAPLLQSASISVPDGPQSRRLRKALSEIYPDGLPSKQAAPDPVIAGKVEKHFRNRGWDDCPARKTIYRYLRARRP
jgi:hypothetical protein